MHWSVVNPLRVAILDDHSLIRLAMKSRLTREAEFSVVGVYGSSAQLLAGLREIDIDLLILDYKLHDGELDGLNLIRLLRTTEGNVTLAANMAGRNRTDFYKLLNRHGIEAANFKSKG